MKSLSVLLCLVAMIFTFSVAKADINNDIFNSWNNLMGEINRWDYTGQTLESNPNHPKYAQIRSALKDAYDPTWAFPGGETVGSGHLKKAWDWLELAEDHLANGNTATAQYWLDKANTEINFGGDDIDAAEEWLQMQ